MSIFNFKKKKKTQIVREEYLITEDVSFSVTEAFRNFKASLSVSMPKKSNGEGTAILFTSANAGEGKTTVATNLALMYAMSDAKVILVDADVRKGRVAKYFKTRSQPGLSDCLSGQVTLEEVTHNDTKNANFSYITCGTHSPRPYELLESEEMKNILTTLKQNYDYVIIDTPPLPALSDALALVPETDGVVVVCRHRISHVGEIAKTLNTLSFAKANILGVVVNDFMAEEMGGYGYGYRYGYGKYGYKYGYNYGYSRYGYYNNYYKDYYSETEKSVAPAPEAEAPTEPKAEN